MRAKAGTGRLVHIKGEQETIRQRRSKMEEANKVRGGGKVDWSASEKYQVRTRIIVRPSRGHIVLPDVFVGSRGTVGRQP